MQSKDEAHKGAIATMESETTEASGPAIALDSRLGRGPVVAGVLAFLLLGILIAFGIRTRVHAEQALATTTRENAVISVAVTTPAQGAAAQEITLPANTQAFIDTPIYARTSGYLRKWYADIGTRVHTGQLLAEIETPELDQQVKQAQSELATAQANRQIAQITSERWTKLLAKNAVSKQETDQAMSDFRARQSALSAAEANVMRLQQLQSLRKDICPLRRSDHRPQRGYRSTDSGGRQQLPEGRAVPYGIDRQVAPICACA